MAISKEVLDELLKDYKGPEDITGPEGLLKQLTKALIERVLPVTYFDPGSAVLVTPLLHD